MAVGIGMGVAFMAWALSSKDQKKEREEEQD
jgi:hypothetical protein